MKKVFTTLLAMALTGMLMANNISISNLSLTGKNTGSHYALVQFDISWENSWRTSTAESNWDAAWVFVKYRVAGGAWQQAWLNDDGHTVPAGSNITPGMQNPCAVFNATTNPGLGAFIYRSDDGATSTFAKTGVQLRWNYGANGVADGEQVEIKVFAIEMVYVPQGAFTVGSGGTESGSFTDGSRASGASIPLSISSEGALTIGQSAGNLWGTSISGDNTIGGAGTLAAAFPKGYGAFYCMKYEMSQQQYVDFLNTLTATQASNRYSAGSTGLRYGISVSGGVYSTNNPYVACNFLSWMDGAAYTDWAGLRPMTELEFEKACRGTATPVAGEYAWGNTTATKADNITNGGASTETTTTPDANAVFLNATGPMRTGVFATGSTTRAQSGGTYYGIKEMSGNLWERTVTVGSTTGRTFTAVNGNGTLSTAGYADISTWPGYVTTEVTGATGSGLRGGSFTDDYMNISSRELGSLDWSDRFSNDGFRAVRTQPPFICGVSTLTIKHVTAGGVAPIDKTVTYGTVSTTLFDGTKCAITRNLGASQQATAATDNIEASAGWYWQFNIKQGYKHDGTNLTPNNTWNTNINNNSDWTAVNDPCSIELGAGWRIPTNAEWTTASGLWGIPYASDLKLHTAGLLSYSNGSLLYRGGRGSYWTSSQRGSSGTSGYYLHLEDNSGSVGSNSMEYGFSVRCIKNLLPTATTTAAISITSNTATSGGNVTDDGGSDITARGVCWSTTTGPTVALATKTSDGTGIGTFTSAIDGLAGNTLYYVRAYATNSAGTAYGNEVSFTTLWSCGSSFSKSHLASGGAAPVDKTVTYETVSTTLFGGTKCAITQNLGATNHASSAADAAEASAGWYWQFNRKQGYKHDGTTLTPAWTITAIDEDSDWLPANDPCTLELGTGWRIPTKTEWTDANANGSWGNSTDTYNSVLKLHAAGLLHRSDGSLYYRGYGSYYWSSVQNDATNGWFLTFGSSNSGMHNDTKAYGFSVRCLRDLLPTLTTTAATVITATTASSGGNVTDDGGSDITARGVCWSTTTGPTVALATKTSDGTGIGTFTSAIDGLAGNTLYYVRAYATNSAGTAYGNEVSFTTTGCFVAGTKINMADGTLKNIEDIQVGDQVKSVNTETMEVVVETVEKTFANPPSGNLSKITFSNGQANTNTKNHPYWVVGKGWSCIDPEAYTTNKTISISLLEVGDQCLVLENGNLVLVTITAIEDQPGLPAPTYNFKVNQTDCYFANGVLVHNKN
jgi:hypothetical protein